MHIALAVIGFFFVLQIVVARWEKRLVWPYGALESKPHFPDHGGYDLRALGGALAQQFAFLGWAPDVKGPQYRINYAFLISPDARILAVIGVGTILKMRFDGTWLFSVGEDGRVYYSTDNQSCIEIDILRRWKSQLVPLASFGELLARHRELVTAHGLEARSFSRGRELDEFKAVREDRFENMRRKGLVCYVPEAPAYWRYTVWGSVRLAMVNYSIGLLRGVTMGRIPRCA